MAGNSELNLRAAHALGKIGLRIFPANATTRIPCVTGWQEKATSDPGAIDQFWISYAKAVPAITTGGNDLLVVDLDVKKGKNGNWEWDAIIRENNFDWSGCPLVRTTTGGHHIYFRQREGELIGCSVSSVASGIDLRGIGGYVIAPGAVLNNGLTYHLVRGDMASIPTLPGDIHSILTSRLNSNKRGIPSPMLDGAQPTSPSVGEIGARETAYAATALKENAAQLVAKLPGSGRNAALNGVAYRMGRLAGAGWIERHVVEEALRKASEANGYVAKDGPQAAQKTFESGFRSGLEDPHPPLADDPVGGFIGDVFHADLPGPSRSPSPTGKTAAAFAAGPIIRRVSDVPAERIEWQWKSRIAVGKLSIIAGDPGLGKSQLTTFLAGKVTTGGQWPNDEGHATPGSVIILTCEDGIGDTVRPRLEAAGANLEKVNVIDGVRTDRGERRSFSIKQNMADLAKALTEIGDVILVVIDPITAYLDGTDTHKTGDVRAALAPLQDVAAQHRVAVVAVSHLNKNSGNGKSISAITGSNAFVAASRTTFLVTKDSNEADRRLLTESKNNLGRAPALAFRIRSKTLPNGIVAPFIEFEAGTVDLSADEALAEGNATVTPISDATSFLEDELANGPVAATTALQQGEG